MRVRRHEKYIQPKHVLKAGLASGLWRRIEIQVVEISRNSSDIDDYFDESSDYTRTVYKYPCYALVHKLDSWTRANLIEGGLAVESGDLFISRIAPLYADKIEVGQIITVFEADLTSMNDVSVVDMYPDDQMEGSWTILGRRVT